MKKTKSKLKLGLLLTLMMSANFAADLKLPKNMTNNFDPKVVNDSTVIKYFRGLLPTISSVYTTPYADTYALIVGPNVVYGNLHSSYLAVGHLFNVYTQDDLTAKLQKLNTPKVDLTKINVADAVKLKSTNQVNKKLIIFIDPDCPYCRQLEQQIVQNQLSSKADIYYMMMPLSIHPNAKDHATKILCSSTPIQTLKDYMLDNQAEPKVKLIPDCNIEPAIERVGSLARSLGINGTPAIVTGSGELIIGSDINAINDYLSK